MRINLKINRNGPIAYDELLFCFLNIQRTFLHRNLIIRYYLMSSIHSYLHPNVNPLRILFTLLKISTQRLSPFFLQSSSQIYYILPMIQAEHKQFIDIIYKFGVFIILRQNQQSSLIKIFQYQIFPMKAYYPLKRSEPTDFVQPVSKYLEAVESTEKALAFRETIAKITQLRNKVTSLSYDQPSLEQANKFIPAIEMYVRFAIIMAKRLNWNKDYGQVVDDVKIVWYDSFNPQLKFMKNDINFDIFCCFYNLGILYFYKAVLLANQELNNSRKQSMKCAKIAYYLFNKMRTVYYQAFVNTGFSDTDYSHLQILESLAQGIFYKNLFNIFKEDEYKLGIDKIASLAGLAQKNFYHGHEVANTYFMKSSYIKPAIKNQILSLSYVESLYHDLMYNTRLAKYYEEEMDNSKDNIIYLIAYQRKALRLLELGLNNQAVVPLLNSRPEQKKELQNVKPLLEASLKTNITRNKQIYKKEQIKEEHIPPPKDPPQNYLIKLEEPETLRQSYEGLATPFADLVDNQSKGLMNDLKDFAKNRILGLQSAYAKLGKNVEIIYNDNFVNFYANLESNSKNKGIPEALKQKIQQIKMNGGKEKLDMEAKILKNNSEQAANRFKEFKNSLANEEQFDNTMRGKYGNKWKRQPSSLINRGYYNEIEVFQKKNEAAMAVNKKILDKYESLLKYIQVVDQNEQAILAVLPKVEVTKFIQDNRAQFDALKAGIDSVKGKKDGLDAIVQEIKKFYQKMNFSEIASKYYKKLDGTNREKMLQEIFSGTYKLIEAFNQKSKLIEAEARKVAQISSGLNTRNKGDDKSKKQFEQVVSKFNDINGLYRQLGQGTGFYTKMSDVLLRVSDTVEGYLSARKIEAQQLEQSINKGGFGAGGANNLPAMYPNQPQQNLGFYVPPPMVFSVLPNQQQQGVNNSIFGQSTDMSDQLANFFNEKPTFSSNVFGQQMYKTQMRL